VLPLLKTDLLEIMLACENGTLDKMEIEWENKYCASVVMASGGYPGDYAKGYEINGTDEFDGRGDIIIFHAGTLYRDEKFFTNGGRVLNATATGDTLQNALDKAYGAVKFINFKDAHYRTDIGGGPGR